MHILRKAISLGCDKTITIFLISTADVTETVTPLQKNIYNPKSSLKHHRDNKR